MDHIEAVLTKKGIAVDENAYSTFKQLRYEMLGRMAIGTGTVMGIGHMFTTNSIRGDGHWDPAVQRARVDAGWRRREYIGLDGKWHSYDFMGPISDWIAATANVMDNFDSMSTATTENMLQKLSSVLAASIFDRSVFAMMEPLSDILNGNGSAAARWGSQFTNSLLPYGGLRNQFGKILSDGNSEIDNDISKLIGERNKWMDLIDPAGANPEKHDYIDGGRVGAVEDIFTRMMTVSTGIALNGKSSKRKDFLIDIEFDARPSVSTSEDGVEYTDKERSAIFSAMGEDGYFGEQIDAIMAEDEVKNYVKRIRTARRNGYTNESLPYDKTILITRLKRALRQAVTRAEARISPEFKQGIEKRAAELRMNKALTKTDRLDELILPNY